MTFRWLPMLTSVSTDLTSYRFPFRDPSSRNASSPLLFTLDPMEKLSSIEIGQEQEHRGDGRKEEGNGVFLASQAGALERQEISSREPANGRDDQKSAEPHPAQTQNIAQVIFGKARDRK